MLIRWLLRKFGYYKCDYGFSCGRHYMIIDGKVIAQSNGDDVWMPDELVHSLVYATLDQGKHWTKPSSLIEREESLATMRRQCACCGEPFQWHRYMVYPTPACPIIDATRTHQGWHETNTYQPQGAKKLR